MSEAKKGSREIAVHSEKQRIPEAPKLREWRDVPRPHEVVAIGDLHGRFDAFVGNGKFANLFTIDDRGLPVWQGDDGRAVFLGDILGDRQVEGTIILEDLHTLREEARKSGGDITLLAGNHDDWALGYLFKEPIIDGTPFENFTRRVLNKGQGVGLLSFVFIMGALSGRKDILNPGKFSALSPQEKIAFTERMLKDTDLWHAMRKSIAESSHAQEVYGNYQVAHIIDDTLFTHCDPTKEMIEDLFKRAKSAGSLHAAVKEINETYQENLRRCLKDPYATPDDAYRAIVQRYIATGNRESIASPVTIHALREAGINAMVHGHTSPAFSNHLDMTADQFPEEFLITTADKGAYTGEFPGSERSVVKIKKDGRITGGIIQRSYRE